MAGKLKPEMLKFEKEKKRILQTSLRFGKPDIGA
jgi:hypothetical protein